MVCVRVSQNTCEKLEIGSRGNGVSCEISYSIRADQGIARISS